MRACLQSSDVNFDDIKGLSECLSDAIGPHSALFTGVDTHFLQMKYYRENL